jgi:hypothetical protein
LEGPENHIKLITYSTEYRIQNTEYTCSKLVYIKLPMYLFFIWRLDLMILMGAITWPLERVGLENLYFFLAQKSLDFQGPPFPMALEMDFPHQNHYVPATPPPPPALRLIYEGAIVRPR